MDDKIEIPTLLPSKIFAIQNMILNLEYLDIVQLKIKFLNSYLLPLPNIFHTECDSCYSLRQKLGNFSKSL